ncbi:adenosine receptor A2a-like [Porites lutea]|uniref:adenosine receptor A2a-like n=1 Tax=Porites lutea TaxID=51062 RepID=UPI003CC5D057
MDHNQTETSIMSTNTTKSVFYCPHIPQLIWDVHDTISPWIFAVVASLISPATVLLNALVIIVVMKRRELQKLSNILLSSLAVTDLLVGAICIPLSAIDGFLLPYQILAAQDICTLDVATACFSLTLTFCSLFHLVLIAWERYVAIRKWRDYKDILTKSRLKKLAMIAWISGPVFILCPFLISVAASGRTSFVVFLASICFIVALILYFYVMVYLEIRKRKFNQILQVSVLALLKTEYRVAKTTALVTAALFLSFVPVLFLPLLGRIFPVLRKMSSWRVVETLVLSNSLVNPLIYCYRDCRLKKLVLELLRIKKPKPRNAVDIVRFIERTDVRGPLKDRVEIIQKGDKNIRLTRSASYDLTRLCDRPDIKPNIMLAKRSMSAPYIHVGGISGED